MEIVPVAGVPRALWVTYPYIQAQRARLLEQPDLIKKSPCSSWRGVFACHGGCAVEGGALAEGQRRERWRPGGLYATAEGRAGIWRGGGGSPPLEALRRFCLSWGVL